MKDLSSATEQRLQLARENSPKLFKAIRRLRSKASKEVRFPRNEVQAVHKTLARSDMSVAERRAYWSTPSDEYQMKMSAKWEAQRFGMNCKHYVMLLDDSYAILPELSEEVSTESPTSYHDSPVYTHPEEYTEKLLEFVEECAEHRGLERYVSAAQQRRRLVNLRNYRDAVVHMQLIGVPGDELAERSRFLSNSNAIWARFMGHADWQAIKLLSWGKEVTVDFQMIADTIDCSNSTKECDSSISDDDSWGNLDI